MGEVVATRPKGFAAAITAILLAAVIALLWNGGRDYPLPPTVKSDTLDSLWSHSDLQLMKHGDSTVLNEMEANSALRNLPVFDLDSRVSVDVLRYVIGTNGDYTDFLHQACAWSGGGYCPLPGSTPIEEYPWAPEGRQELEFTEFKDSIALIVEKKDFIECGEDHRCIDFVTLSDYLEQENSVPSCPDLPNPDTPVAKLKGHGCTAFAIAPNTIATAYHCVDETQEKYLLFGFYDKTRFAIEDVIPFENLTLVKQNPDPEVDYAIYDFEGKSRKPLPLASIDQTRTDIHLTMLGHPLKRSLTLDQGYAFQSPPKVALNSFWGSSGSPVFETASRSVVGLLRGGPKVPDVETDPIRNCSRPFMCCRGEGPLRDCLNENIPGSEDKKTACMAGAKLTPVRQWAINQKNQQTNEEEL